MAAGAKAEIVKLEEPVELDHRVSGEIEVSLLWRRSDNALTVRVVDSGSGIALRLQVLPAEALDAFNHPYVYAAVRGIDVWEEVPLAASS
jgi:hypothetical protein